MYNMEENWDDPTGYSPQYSSNTHQEAWGNNYNQNPYPQNTYKQNSYEQNSYEQNSYGQNSYGQDYSQNSWGNSQQSEFRQRGGRGRGGGSRGRGGGRGGGSSSGNWRNNSENRDQGMSRSNDFSREPDRTVYVASRSVGKLIGKGGQRISDLQAISNAKIIVTKETKDDETLVKIFGDEYSVNKAVELIKDTVFEKPPPEPITFTSTTSTSSSFYDDVPIIDWDQVNAEYEAHQEAELKRLGPIIKKFYEEKPEITALTEEEVAEFRLEKNNIVVQRTFEEKVVTPIPKPVQTFEQAFHNYPEILDEIEKAGFTEPSPIQCQTWPILMSGEDMIGIAQTGTGKTLAFLLPALIHIDGQIKPREEREGPSVLVLAPTRELALQIERECNKYYYKGIKSVCVYGGGSKKDQINAIEEGVDIVIATPGRMNDLYMSNKLNIKAITYVVLDEADRMLDMGFEPQIRKVMYGIRRDRQTVMTSATWPLGVRNLAKSYMVNPIQVYVGSLDLAAVHTVTQTILLLDDEDHKYETFLEFAKNIQPHEKVICFCGKKTKAALLASELAMNNIFCQTLHGDLEQCDREQALVDISDGSVQILIATDLASRGIDIEDISHVVNYDFPRNIEEYVHRVGRTGRAGKSGDSISYFTRSDWGQAEELIPILEEASQYVPEEIYKMAERFKAKKAQNGDRPFRRGRGGGGNRRW